MNLFLIRRIATEFPCSARLCAVFCIAFTHIDHVCSQHIPRLHWGV